MAREPSYPKDAAVGSAPATAPKRETGGAAETASQAGGKGDGRRTKHLVAGAAIGIGSAAIVAALLYANRNRKA